MRNNKKAIFKSYHDPYSILVVTWFGRLKELKCPFQVRVRIRIGNLFKGEVVEVQSVGVSSETDKTVFLIENKAYYYHHFDILIRL